MRISAINNYTQKSNLTKCTRMEAPPSLNSDQKQYSNVPNDMNLAFKSRIGWGGLIGGTLGTAAGAGIGVLLTAATGGLVAPMIALMTGTAVGAIGGNIKEESLRCHDSSDSDYDDFDDSYYDVRSWP